MMTSSKLRGAIAATALAITAAIPHAVYAQVEDSAAPQDAAQAAYQRGRDHAKAKRWAEAEKEFQDAYRLRPAWDIAGNLGIAELELGRFVAAAKHLDESLRAFPGSGKAEHRALIDGAYQRALTKVGRLDIRASESGATIVIDGQSVGIDPLGRVVFVEPGPHAVEATKGNAKDKKDVTADAGKELSVVLSLVETKGPDPIGQPPVEEADDGAPAAAWILLAGGGTVAVVGGVLLGVGLSGQSGAKDDAAGVVADGGSCEPASSGFESRCDDAVSSASSGTTLAVTGGILLGTGVAAAVGGLVWILTSGGSDGASDSAGARRAVQLLPVLGSDTAGLWMRGTY